jgi:hypothetical protein
VAAVGTIAGAASSAVSAGADIYGMGKLTTSEMSHFDATTQAARRAAADLCLTPTKEERRKGGVALLEFKDDKGASVTVRIEPRTAMLVNVRIDVGWFGSQPTARLFLARMRTHLPQPAVPSTAPASLAAP